jgi:hypothetical protein
MPSLGLRPRVAAPWVCAVALFCGGSCGGQKSGTEDPPRDGPLTTGGSASAQGGAAPAQAGSSTMPGASGAGQGGSGANGGAPSSLGGSSPLGTGGRLVFSSAGRGGAFVLLPPDTGTAGAAPVCSELSVVPKPVVPTVLVLVDNSSSMFEKDQSMPAAVAPWDLLYTTLMDPAGAIKSLEDEVRFGFTSYKGNPMAQMDETNVACAELKSVPYALNNFAAIDEVYAELGTEWMPGIKWETPTGHALTRATADLAAFQADPPGPKNILLVTDGNPNTCQVIDPQCGQDLSIRAAQDAYALGIKTFVIGIGEVIQGNVGCEEQWGRCGPDHLQDLANAGLGLPVTPPPETFVYQSCADRYGRVLQGAYDTTGMPGAAPYYTAASTAELTQAIEDLLKAVLTCTFDMDVRVTGNPALGSVLVGVSAEPVPYGDANGWKLEDNRYQVTLQGTACDTFKAEQTLDISFPCDPLTGMPIAVKR